jgi:beta-1,4-N-acetylglucosaminyltransferase
MYGNEIDLTLDEAELMDYGNKPKLLFVSASGGHFEQLMRLKPLMQKYPSIIVTEKTAIKNNADYHMIQTGHKDTFVLIKSVVNFSHSLFIWLKEKPEYVISTGSMIIIPFVIFAKLTGKQIIFIESFSRINNKSKTGAFVYNFADLFIVQWKSLLEIYPNAVYGGWLY